jgi:cell wall-associated NlpC family hydrolase
MSYVNGEVKRGDDMKRRRIACAIAAGMLLSVVLWLSVAADWDLVAGDSARVAYTAGEGVNLRTAPGAGGEIIAMLPEDYPVVVQDGLTLDDGTFWYSVSVDTAVGWTSGWVLADYLAGDGGLGTFVYEGDAAASEVPVAVSTGGEALNLRAAPWIDADILAAVPDGAWVDVLAPVVVDEAGNAWSQIRYDGIVGFGASAYLGGAIVDVAAPQAGLSIGTLAVVAGTAGDGLHLRAEAGPYGASLGVLAEGATGEVIDGPLFDMTGDIWFMLATELGSGWSHGAYLADSSSALATGGGTSAGASLVDAALDYAGVPYLWAGVTPNGFDCSGFTYYLMSDVLGYQFSRAIDLQMESGYAVSTAELLPGDLVFFQNTYKWGLSHVGIYIGDNQFIHAENEDTGVRISSLDSPYYSTRWYGARRVS